MELENKLAAISAFQNRLLWRGQGEAFTAKTR
jgi:hypothetical protein